MGYIDPDSDAIVVAGGDGTIMEVVNGLMRRWDVVGTSSCLGYCIVQVSYRASGEHLLCSVSMYN